MEFAEEGGEGPTPYEVLLLDAMRGDSQRFTRQDSVEETWRVMQPLLDSPPPVHPYAPGHVGPEGGRAPGRGLRRLARPLGGVVSMNIVRSGALSDRAAAAAHRTSARASPRAEPAS